MPAGVSASTLSFVDAHDGDHSSSAALGARVGITGHLEAGVALPAVELVPDAGLGRPAVLVGYGREPTETTTLLAVVTQAMPLESGDGWTTDLWTNFTYTPNEFVYYSVSAEAAKSYGPDGPFELLFPLLVSQQFDETFFVNEAVDPIFTDRDETSGGSDGLRFQRLAARLDLGATVGQQESVLADLVAYLRFPRLVDATGADTTVTLAAWEVGVDATLFVIP